MYSAHNFYFNPFIASSALLPVIDCKGWKQQGLSNRNHLFDTVRITHLSTSLTLRTWNAIAEWIAYCSSVFVSVLLRGRSWTTQSPNDTPERERSLLGRRSQVMSTNISGIISSG
jgi:hypothetical protein